MATRNFEIQLKDLTLDGVACVNPIIEWEKPSCGDIKCVLQNGTVLKVELPEDCIECFYVTIDCQNSCSDCEIQRLKVCPCRVDADCPDCEVCGPNGVCITTCPEGKFCNEGECKECADGVPCPCNQVCVDGECECPVNKPYKNSKGCCSECATDAHCPPCFVCTPDGCVPKFCPTGVCDPDSGACVECYNSGQCPPNQCCVNGQCECCQGFYKDPISGNCIPLPTCQRDGDCPPCHICNNGNCVPVTCPTGYVRVNGDPCCKPECDCNNPNCAKDANCLPDTPSGKCYCEECGGGCENNGDCPTGCYCNGSTCVPNPCYATCVDGSDCGPGCGCDQGVCVPCSSLDCDTCDSVRGCSCTNGECKKGCSGPCFSANDCAPGCGCDEDGYCKPCSDFDCVECPHIFGCKCLNGNCVDDPCSEEKCKCLPCDGIEDCGIGCYCFNGVCAPNPCDGPCSGDYNCAPGCHCVGGRCIPCNGPCGNDGDPTNDPPCDNVLSIVKFEDGCDVEGRLTTNKCCQCEDITVGFDFTALADSGQESNMNLNVILSKGKANTWTDFLGLPTLNSTNILNDYPLTGAFEVKVTTHLVGADSNCNPIVSVTNKIEQSFVYNLSGAFNMAHNFSYYKAGGCLNLAQGKFLIVKNTYSITPVTEFVFPNDCKFRVEPSIIKTITKVNPSDDTDIPVVLTKEASCRKPLFTWFKSASKSNLFNNANIFRKKYISKVGTQFVDRLYDYLQDGLEYGKYYGLRTDCGCAGDTVYDCNGDKSADRLTFNHPKDFTFTVDSCGTVVTFDEVKINCDVMIESPMRPRYEILLNGKVVATLTLPNNGILIIAGTTYTLAPPEKLNTVSIRLLDTDCPYQLTKSVPNEGLTLSVSTSAKPCGVDPINLTISVFDGVGPYAFTVYKDNVSILVGGFPTSPYNITIPRMDGNYRVDIIDANGCMDSFKFTYNDNSNSLTQLISATTKCIGGDGYIVITNNSSEDLNISIDAGPNQLLPKQSTSQYQVTLGIHSVNIALVSDPLCTIVTPISISVDCCEDPDVTVTQACLPNGTKSITITNNGTQNISAQVLSSSNAILGSCASIIPGGFCIKNNISANESQTVKVQGVGTSCSVLDVSVPSITCSDCDAWKNGLVLTKTCSGSTVNWTLTNSNSSGSANVTGSFNGTILAGASQSGSVANTVNFTLTRADDLTCVHSLSDSCQEGCSSIDSVTIGTDCSDLNNPLFVVNNPNLINIRIYKDNILYSNTNGIITTGSFTVGSSPVIRVELQSDSNCFKTLTVNCITPPSLYTVTYDCINGIQISGGYSGLITIDNGPTNHTYPTSPLYLTDGAHTVKLLVGNTIHNININCCKHTVALDVLCDNTQPNNQKGVANVTLGTLAIGNSYTVNLYNSSSQLVDSATFVATFAVDSVTFLNLSDNTYFTSAIDNTYNTKSYVGNNNSSTCIKTSASKVIDCDITGNGNCVLNVQSSDFLGTTCVGITNTNCFQYTNNTGVNVTLNTFYLLIGNGTCFNENNSNWTLISSVGLNNGSSSTTEAPANVSCVKFQIVKDPTCIVTGWLSIDGARNITSIDFY